MSFQKIKKNTALAGVASAVQRLKNSSVKNDLPIIF